MSTKRIKELKTMGTEIEKNRAVEIVSLHGEIEGLLKLSLDKAIRIGELLSEQKANLLHGEFIPWVKANLPFTERTAQNYMKIYNQRALLKNENVSHLTGAYALLTTSNETRLSPDNIESPHSDEWSIFVRGCLREAKERLNNLDNIPCLKDRIVECKLLVDVLRFLTQSSAEILLYREAHFGKLLRGADG